MIYDDKWIEIWCEGDEERPHILIVTPDKHRPGYILITDPKQDFKVIFESQKYEDITEWLVEDEYTLADGRMFLDDGWPLRTNNPK
jgi:hypothetical protein